jgi:hypothetical protein
LIFPDKAVVGSSADNLMLGLLRLLLLGIKPCHLTNLRMRMRINLLGECLRLHIIVGHMLTIDIRHDLVPHLFSSGSISSSFGNTKFEDDNSKKACSN